MISPLNPIFRALAIITLLHFTVAVDSQITARSIPSTEGNQDFFSLAQSLIVNGVRKISSCGPELTEVERCIRVCNAPGLSERGGCCCIARPNEFTVGLRGGCRYSQRVQNFTSRLIYKSSPVGGDKPFFGKTCSRTLPTGTGGPCTCSIQWEADTEVLKMLSPLPTPSVSAAPILTATPSPVPSVSPVLTPETTDSEPTTEESITPTPENELIPSGPVLPPPSKAPSGPVLPSPSKAPSGPVLPSPSEGSKDLGIIPTETDEELGDPSPSAEVTETPVEQQATEDDGSVCVDERYLKQRGFAQDTLIHEQGVMANVLCPFGRSLPCGTPDHKVRFAGQDMSYEYMCARPDVHCRATRMKVNSVYTHLWTDVAHEDVMLTMFDIRYPETAQKALHSVMRQWRTTKKRVFV